MEKDLLQINKLFFETTLPSHFKHVLIHRLNFRGASFREAEITPVQPAQDNTCEGRNAHSSKHTTVEETGTIVLFSGFQLKLLSK